MNISISQALDIWGELVSAYYDMNGFGGDVAEIYIHRVMSHDPTLTQADEAFKKTDTYKDAFVDVYRKAMHALYELFVKFEEDFECKISILEGREKEGRLGLWFVEGPLITHRVHVKVQK